MSKTSKKTTKEVVLAETVVAYSIEELLTKVVALVQSGYTLDFNRYNGYPKNFMSTYEVTLFNINKPEVEPTDEE